MVYMILATFWWLSLEHMCKGTHMILPGLLERLSGRWETLNVILCLHVCVSVFLSWPRSSQLAKLECVSFRPVGVSARPEYGF